MSVSMILCTIVIRSPIWVHGFVSFSCVPVELRALILYIPCRTVEMTIFHIYIKNPFEETTFCIFIVPFFPGYHPLLLFFCTKLTFTNISFIISFGFYSNRL